MKKKRTIGASRDPRVVLTGRENLRLVLGVVFALVVVLGIIFLKMFQQGEDATRNDDSAVSSSGEAPEPEQGPLPGVNEVLERIPAEVREKFSDIDSQTEPFSSGLDFALAEMAKELHFVPLADFRRFESGDVRDLVGGLAKGADTRARSPEQLRGTLFEIHGRLAVDLFERSVDGIPTICGILQPETKLGSVSESYVGFIAHQSGDTYSGMGRPLRGEATRWKKGHWVTFRGYYVCDFYFWNKIADSGAIPLCVSGFVTHSVPSQQPPEEVSKEELNALFKEHDKCFPSRFNPPPPPDMAIPREVPPWAFMAFAGLALAHEKDDKLFGDAKPVFKEMMQSEFYDNLQESRGNRYVIRGTVADVQVRHVGPNPYRLKKKQVIFVDGRYGYVWIETPLHFDVKVADLVEVEAWFASRIYYRSYGKGIVDKPYFVARSVKPFEPQVSAGKAWWQKTLPIAIVSSTLGLILLFTFLVFRDRKRSREIADRVRGMRKKRRETAREGEQATS